MHFGIQQYSENSNKEDYFVFRLVSSPNRNLPVVRQPLEEWISGNIDPGVPTSKKSLVNKLEIISKGTTLIFTGNSLTHILL
jgi:hypothetical protein